MAKDQTEEVLIVRNNETGQVGAVTGLNEDGTPKITDPMFVTLEDLVKFKKGQNPLEAFLSNFEPNNVRILQSSCRPLRLCWHGYV